MGIAHLFRAKAYWAHPLDEKLSPQMRSRDFDRDLRVVWDLGDFFGRVFFCWGEATKRSPRPQKGAQTVV